MSSSEGGSAAAAVVSISQTETECQQHRLKDKTDPGACRHGNFINYYQFHPAEERLRQLPRGVWHADESSSDRKYVGIDVGCNAGDLTLAIYDFLNENLKADVSLLGVDLDPVLIERAIEGVGRNIGGLNSKKRDVDYKCVDFMSSEVNEVIDEYLTVKKRDLFDVAFCFSITMWIHLNHGDFGLVKFLRTVCQKTRLIVVEPQPWKCYRNACRRMRRANVDNIPTIDSLRLTGDVEKHVENILNSPDCGFEKITESGNNEWGRKLLIYKRRGV